MQIQTRSPLNLRRVGSQAPAPVLAAPASAPDALKGHFLLRSLYPIIPAAYRNAERKSARGFELSSHVPRFTAWIDEVSTGRYRPRLRLPDQDAFQFPGCHYDASCKPGNDFAIRCYTVFLAYARNRDADVKLIDAVTRSIVWHSKIDWPETASPVQRRSAGVETGTLRAFQNSRSRRNSRPGRG